MINGKTSQALATWSNDFLKAFTQKNEAANALLGRLESTDPDARHYACKFFMRFFPEVMSTPAQTSRCIRALSAAINSDDANVSQYLITWIRSFPEAWQVQLAEELKGKTDEENPAVYLDNGAPFLSSPSKGDLDDDIPF